MASDSKNPFRPQKIRPDEMAGPAMAADASGPDGGNPLAGVQAAHQAADLQFGGGEMPANDVPRPGQYVDGNFGGVHVEGRVPKEMLQFMQDGPQGAGATSQVPRQFQGGHLPMQKPSMYRNAAGMFAPPQAAISHEAIAAVQAGIKRITENYEEILLPSRGKFYQNPLLGDGVVHVRPMTGHEEEILATNRFVKKGQAVNMIFRNCLQEQVDPEELLTIDRTFLLIYLRGISYTQDYEVNIKCPECENKFGHTINLDGLHLEYCPDDFDPDSLSTVLPATGFKLRYRMSLGKDEALIANHRDRRVKQFGENSADDTLLYRASLLTEDIETPDGHRVTGQAFILGILEQLPIKDVAHIRNLMSEPPFGVDTRVDIDCPHCGHEFDITLPMEAGFFFPIQKRKTGRRA